MDKEVLKLLLADDDEDDFMITRDLLSEVEGSRFELDWVTNYDAALEAIGRLEHHVYLLDYRLGERTGLDLLREAISMGCKAPMILLTGQGDHDVDIKAMKAGASDYLIKGQFDPSLLERSIRYAIERKQAEETLRAAEQRFRLISEALPIGVFETNGKGVCIYMNTRFQRIVGVTLPEGHAMRLHQMFHPDEREAVWKEWSEAMGNSRGFSKECRIQTDKGKEIWIHFRSSPMFSDADGSKTFTGTVEDITQRKKNEEALRKSHKRLEKALEDLKLTQGQMVQSEKMASIGQLAAGIAHEINNPTGFISSNLNTLEGYAKDLISIIDENKDLASGLKKIQGNKEGESKIFGALDRIEALEK